VTWLAEHLKRRWAGARGALLVVTHDRWFLDEVSTQTWEVHDGVVDRYEGGYAAYVLQRVERDRISNVTEQRRQNLMKKELAWLRRGAPARSTKPKFRIDAANALIADVPPIRDTVQLARMATARLGKDVVSLINAGMTYGAGDEAREVLKGIDWHIGPGERTGILGENGAGKSTLLKLITGELEPTKGRVKMGITVRVASLSQRLEELDDVQDERLSAVVKRYSSIKMSDGTEMTPGQLLERFGFTPSQMKTPVHKLSGGQRRRLQILMVLLSEPNVLVLDEPTNDLDTDVLAALEDLLDSWPGTLIVVSHDRYLMERITDQQYAVLDGSLRHLPGGVDEYVKLSRERRTASAGVGTFGVASTGNGPTLPASERRNLTKDLQAAERRMQRIADASKAIQAKMAEHDQMDYEGLATMGDELRSLAAENATLEERWLAISDRLAG
jgi:ATP-binding cassette subfamily F protein uup